MRKIVQGYMWKELLADLVRWLRSTAQVLCSTQEQKNIELLSENCKQKHYNKSAFAMLILQEKAEKRANQSSCLLILVGTVLYLQSTRAQYKLLLCSNTVPHRAEVNFFQNSNYGTFVIHPCWEELFLLLLICLYLLSTLCLDKANFIYSKHILCVWNKANFPSYMTHDNKECYEKNIHPTYEYAEPLAVVCVVTSTRFVWKEWLPVGATFIYEILTSIFITTLKIEPWTT